MKLPQNILSDAEQVELPQYLLGNSSVPIGSILITADNDQLAQVIGHRWAPNKENVMTDYCILRLVPDNPQKFSSEFRIEKKGWSICTITLSDKGYRRERIDTAAPAILSMIVPALNPVFTSSYLVPDDKGRLKSLLCKLALEDCYDLIVTTGGTGVGSRDITPQITESLLDVRLPGFTQAMLIESLKKTPNAIISRAAAGLIGNALVLNLPGSEKAVRENLLAILPAMGHALDKIHGDERDCGAMI